MVGGLRLISRTGMVMTKIERHMVMADRESHEPTLGEEKTGQGE